MSISDVWQYILEWWNDYQADPRSDADEITSGLRRPQEPSGNVPYYETTKSNWQVSACQYWVKGIPSICTYWDDSTGMCTRGRGNEGFFPTGYGEGGCDGLGRRHWCSDYVETKPFDPEEYICILPSIERSGAGKPDLDVERIV
jgi:hypothetical protein